MTELSGPTPLHGYHDERFFGPVAAGEAGLPEDAPPEGRPVKQRSIEERAVEAVLLCAVEPLSPGFLGELLEVSAEEAQAICERLAASYEAEERGFVLARVAGGYRLQSHPDMAAFVERFAMEGMSSKLSAAALETLAIVAYKQPISRGQIAALRGVNVDGVVRMLVARGYIEPVSRADGPGQPILYGTTQTFLEKLGLDSLADLPPVVEFLPAGESLVALEEGLDQHLADPCPGEQSLAEQDLMGRSPVEGSPA